MKSESNSASAKLQEEKDTLEKSLGAKTDELQEKSKMIIQVRCYVIRLFGRKKSTRIPVSQVAEVFIINVSLIGLPTSLEDTFCFNPLSKTES